jgi:Lar family restriction alleviation protein
MIELKPCPFCGGEAFLAEYDYALDNGYIATHFVECNGCSVTTFEYDSPEEAAEAWNRRVTHAN